MYMCVYSSTNHIFQCLEYFNSLAPSKSRSICNSSRTISLHRHGENSHFKLKTRVSEPFWTSRRSFLCTGAVNTHFVHKRSGFTKLCNTMAPVSENCSSANSPKNKGNLTVLAQKVRQPRADWPLFFRCVRRRPPKDKHVCSSPSPVPSRAPPGHFPAPGAKHRRFARGVLKLKPLFDDRRGALNFDHRACRQHLALISTLLA